MDAYDQIHAVYEDGRVAFASEPGPFQVETVTEGSGDSWTEYHAIISWPQ